MARIQGFTAPSTIRSSDQGFSAFETYGRRVAGQFDQAASDIREIGRSKAAVTSMLGRWPLNIIDLEQRAQAEVDRRNQAAAPGRGAVGPGGVNFRLARPERGSRGTGNQGAGSYDQMSEGAGALGRMVGGPASMGGTMSPEYRRAIQAQQDAETARINRLDQAAADKRWNLYERDLDKYNENLDKWAAGAPNEPVSTTNDPSSPYYDPSGQIADRYYPAGTTGGGGDVGTPENTPNDYGGGGGGWFGGGVPDSPYVSDQ